MDPTRALPFLALVLVGACTAPSPLPPPAAPAAVAERPAGRGANTMRAAAAERLANRARAALERGSYRAALRDASDAADLDPRFETLEHDARITAARWTLTRAEAAFKSGSFGLARVRAEEARMVAPGIDGPEEILDRIETARTARREAGVARASALLVNAGRRHLDDARYDHAADHFRRALVVRDDPEVHALLVQARIGYHRRRAYLALSRADRADAAHHLESLLAITDDAVAAGILDDVRNGRGHPRR